MDKLVVGIAGKIGSGKTTIADYVKERYGFSTYKFSDILADILERLHLSKSRKNFQKLGMALRREWPHILAQALEKDIREDSKLVAIDGVRYENEVDMLKNFDHSLLLYVETPVKVRYKRCKKRGEKGEDKVSFEEFLEAEGKETEKNIEKISQLADHRVGNEKSKKELFQQVDQIMEEYEEFH